MKFRFTYKLTSQLTLTVTTTVDVLLVRLRLTPDGTRITVRVHVRWSNLVCISFDQLTDEDERRRTNSAGWLQRYVVSDRALLNSRARVTRISMD
jgi:hypothetical protein